MNRTELEKLADAALHLLRDGAAQHAEARANADYLDAWVKTELARIKDTMVYQDSDAAKTAAAMRSPDYLTALQGKKEADALWYLAQFKREAANAHINAWQTVCANERADGKIR